MRKITIASVVVTFNTDPVRLAKLLDLLRGDTLSIVADNSTIPAIAQQIEAITNSAGGFYIGFGDNIGVGAAQNAGIRTAVNNGFNFVLLMDDDSQPDSAMVSTLRVAFDKISKLTGRPAVVCATPVGFEPNTNSLPPSPLSGIQFEPVRDMMSSGSLVPMQVFRSVGPMDESLFVDIVDYDWGWRAKALSHDIFRIPQARLRHQLGVGMRLPLGVKINLPNPVRHYYQFRNLFLVWKRSHVPTSWKWKRAIFSPLKFLVVLTFTHDRKRRLKYVLNGIRDGYLGKSGKLT